MRFNTDFLTTVFGLIGAISITVQSSAIESARNGDWWPIITSATVAALGYFSNKHHNHDSTQAN